MAAMRNWLSSLHGEVAADGVYVGTLTVTALIAGSAGHKAFTSGALSFDVPNPDAIPTVSPDELAERYADMLSARDRFEEVWPPLTL